jgi:type III restriction enzyme
MSRTLQFQFDENQAHQLEAISSVVDLFDGMDKIETGFTLGEDIFPNLPEDETLDEDQLRDNLRAIQERSNVDRSAAGAAPAGEVVYACSSPVTISPHLEIDDGLVLEGTGNDSVRTFHFTVEMETGTGKTYVYLRTLHELRREYGFTKFIIVVPSVAIFEGVIKSYEVTKAHFASLYDNERPPLIRYDGGQIGRIRDFASNQELTLMVMTRDAFNKSSNNFYKATEKLQGELKPYQWVQLTRPIVILDEPQNMNSEKAREAIRTLKPLFVLRYSATHRDTPNPVYRLTPVDAFRQNLVKQIQVIGLTQLGNLNVPVLQLLDVKRNPITARVRALKLQNGETSEQEFTLKQKTDLFALTKHEPYRGYVVTEIKLGRDGEDPRVIFENGASVSYSEELVGDRQDVFRAQIEKTIETHLARQAELKRDGIKVLSLFFIDRVKNYTAADGIIKRLFDSAFDRLKAEHPDFAGYTAAEVREGYFAKPKADSPDEDAVDTDGSNQKQREMEKAAFELIMRKKERLLSFDEPVSFIFAHSALKEGWDNPNVFQICTLNNTASTLKKRQEIGRGLRLAVDQTGRRAENHDVNVLTVIANESYESYVANLQREYVDDGYGEGMPKPKKPDAAIAKRNDKLFSSQEFREFWAKLNQRMRYEIRIDSGKLVKLCIERLNRTVFPDPVMVVTKGVFVIRDYTLKLVEASEKQAKLRIQYEDTLGNREDSTLAVPKGADLEKVKKDKNLRGFKVSAIEPTGSGFRVKFDNGMQLTKDEPIRFQTERAAATQRSEQRVSDQSYPVFDIIGRVTAETNLTRRTIT